jgi:hypothetical protein
MAYDSDSLDLILITAGSATFVIARSDSSTVGDLPAQCAVGGKPTV